jgi:hypothetical protein
MTHSKKLKEKLYKVISDKFIKYKIQNLFTYFIKLEFIFLYFLHITNTN